MPTAFCVERTHSGVSIKSTNSVMLDASPLSIPSTVPRVDVFERGSIGCYFLTNFDSSLHYDIPVTSIPQFILRAKNSGIIAKHWPVDHRRVDGKLVRDNNTDSILWFCNGIDFEERISKMDLKHVAGDLFFNEEGRIPKRDKKRGNRQISVGYPTSISCAYHGNETTSRPAMLSGTRYLAPLMAIDGEGHKFRLMSTYPEFLVSTRETECNVTPRTTTLTSSNQTPR